MNRFLVISIIVGFVAIGCNKKIQEREKNNIHTLKKLSDEQRKGTSDLQNTLININNKNKARVNQQKLNENKIINFNSKKSTRKLTNINGKRKSNTDNKNNYLKVKIKKGESLWVISQKYLKDPTKWRELLRYNNIPTPNKIRPGLVLKVPDYLSKIILAKISFFSGNVKVQKTPMEGWGAAYIKEQLLKSSKIRSYAKSRALITFYTGDKLTVKENTIISLNEIVNNKINSITIKLNIGKILLKIVKLKKGRGFTVETPAAIAGVRGTEFIVKSDKSKRSLFGVYDGKILVSAQGKSVVVKAGYGVEVKYGKPPSKPFKLPERPEILKN